MVSISLPASRRSTRARTTAPAESPALATRLQTLLPLRRPRFLRGAKLDRAVSAPTLTTARLTLRPHRVSDAEEWFGIQSDPRVVRYLPWPKRDRAESLQHLRHRTRHTRLQQSGDFLALAIEQDGVLVGDVSLHLRQVQADRRSVEVGWLLATHASGSGLAVEAATAIIAFAFSTVRARWVLAVMDEDNEASQRLATRLGFRQISLEAGERTMALAHP